LREDAPRVLLVSGGLGLSIAIEISPVAGLSGVVLWLAVILAVAVVLVLLRALINVGFEALKARRHKARSPFGDGDGPR
jgi:hypothetical protein